MATVLTSDGEHVQVVGTPSHEENLATSVDREYVVGATYEFHPEDAETDSYKDNACTATERLRGEDIPPSLRGEINGAEVTPKPNSSNDINPASAIAGGVAVAGVAGAAVWLRRRGI